MQEKKAYLDNLIEQLSFDLGISKPLIEYSANINGGVMVTNNLIEIDEEFLIDNFESVKSIIKDDFRFADSMKQTPYKTLKKQNFK